MISGGIEVIKSLKFYNTISKVWTQSLILVVRNTVLFENSLH